MRAFHSRLLFAAFVLSLAVHAAGAAFMPFRSARIDPEPQTALSTAVRIEVRDHPAPHPRPAQHRQPNAAEAHRVLVPHDAPSPVLPRRIAFLPRRIPARRRAPDSATSLPQVDFEKTIAMLRARNDPLAAAARPVPSPAARKRYTVYFSASVGTGPSSEGILTPVNSWRQGGYQYYYVRYWVQYADGTTETGIVPWPLRYPVSNDPFRAGLRHLALPVPLPDYSLPAGTILHPLVAFCYAHRDELASCPIERG